MRPLRLVDPADLKVGKTYLIQEKRPEFTHLNSKGVFVKNDYPTKPYYCTITHFTNVMVKSGKRSDLTLPDCYWNYYEADAIERAYITQALRVITGDPDFIFDDY